MDFLNWRNLIAVLLGGAIAGLAIGLYFQYKESKREEIASLIAESQRLVYENKTGEAQKIASKIPPPSAAYPHLLIGDFYYGNEEFERALNNFEKAEGALADTDEVLRYLILEKEAFILYREGKLKESLKRISSVSEGAPNFCTARLLEAQIYAQLKEKENALSTLRRILSSCQSEGVVLAAKRLIFELSEGGKKEFSKSEKGS